MASLVDDLTKVLIREQIITEQERDIYRYGMEKA